MMYPKTELAPELEFIKTILVNNGYLKYLLSTTFRNKSNKFTLND